jgi:DNA repair protein RecO (recombination protein O)
MVSQTGFLISYLKYGDNDAVLHCFTKEKGFQSFFVRGIYSRKNRKKALLFPLNEIRFHLNQTPKSGQIPSISNLDLISNFDFFDDVKAVSVIFFVSDFLNQVLKNENKSPKIYDAIRDFLVQLKNHNYQSHLIFLFEMLKIHGFSPLISEQKFLNPEFGNFQDEIVHHLFDEEISDVWKQLILSENLYTIKMNPKIKNSFLNSILIYFHYHFADFHVPKSLEVVQQIFE